MLYAIGNNITDAQFLYIDLIALVPLSIFQAWTGSYHKLTKDIPTSTLFYYPVLTSVIVAALIQLSFQVFFFFNIRQQPFYRPVDPSIAKFGSPQSGYEGNVLFYVANFQYLVTAISFSIAKPFRKQIWTNFPYMFSIASILIIDVLILFLPNDSWLPKLFNILPFVDEDTGESYNNYKAWIALGILLNCILTYAAEKCIITSMTRKADKIGKLKKSRYYDEKMSLSQQELKSRGVKIVSAPLHMNNEMQLLVNKQGAVNQIP